MKAVQAPSAALSIGITTAPRRQPTFEQSIASLRETGFNEEVHVFAEPDTFMTVPSLPRTHVHVNAKKQGCFANWKTTLLYLLSNTKTPWLMIVQDDAVWAPGSADVLRTMMRDSRAPQSGFLSPYTSGSSTVVTKAFVDGWNETRAGWQFWGALALCMSRPAAEQLSKHSRFVKHCDSRAIDAVVAASMIDMGRPSYVHVPSLVDHIGVTSTIGRDREAAAGRRGYRFGKAKIG
jgi:hypothetical protein